MRWDLQYEPARRGGAQSTNRIASQSVGGFLQELRTQNSMDLRRLVAAIACQSDRELGKAETSNCTAYRELDVETKQVESNALDNGQTGGNQPGIKIACRRPIPQRAPGRAERPSALLGSPTGLLLGITESATCRTRSIGEVGVDLDGRVRNARNGQAIGQANLPSTSPSRKDTTTSETDLADKSNEKGSWNIEAWACNDSGGSPTRHEFNRSGNEELSDMVAEVPVRRAKRTMQ